MEETLNEDMDLSSVSDQDKYHFGHHLDPDKNLMIRTCVTSFTVQEGKETLRSNLVYKYIDVRKIKICKGYL